MLAKRSTFADSKNIYWIYCVAMFFVAQFLYYLANAGFHSTFGGVDPFVVDLTFMQDHFWQSLFYYHIAPPLYIFYVAIFKVYFPPYGELGFYFLHSILGAYATYSLYKVQRALNVNPVLATFLTTAFVLSPSFNFEETMSFYDFPTACLLIISAWQLVKLLNDTRFASAFSFFTVIALLCSVRSLYHVAIYMVPVILITSVALKKHWKTILVAALIPFLFVFSVYFKNYLLFNAFTTSSYFGETLDTVVMQFNVDLKEREEGIKKGFFSDLALCPSSADTIATPTATSKYAGQYCYAIFANQYRNAYIKTLSRDYQDIPILSCAPVVASSTAGMAMPRRNCVGNIGMSKEYQKNALQAIVHYPGAYWKGVKASTRNYFMRTVRYYYSVALGSRNLPMTLSESWPELKQRSYSIYLLIMLPVLIVFAIRYYFRSGSNAYNKRIIVLYLICNIIFTTLVLTLLTGISQARYRFYIDGMYVMLLGLLIETVALPFIRRVLH